MLVVAAACAAAVLGATGSSLAPWLGAGVLAVVARQSLKSRSTVGQLLVYGYLSFGALAALLYRPDPADYTGSFRPIAVLAAGTRGHEYLAVFLAVAFATWLGAMLAYHLLFGTALRTPPIPTLSIPSWGLLLAVVPIALEVYGTGPSTLLRAPEYLARTGPQWAASIGRALGPVACLMAGYFALDRRCSGSQRIAGALLAAGYLAVYLALATRDFALWLPLVIAGSFLTGRWTRRQQRALAVVAVAGALVLLQVPIVLRGLPDHGLYASVGYLFGQPAIVFSGNDPIGNVLFGAPLTLYVGHDIGTLPWDYAVTSLSPLPSALNNWPAIQPLLRVNDVTPYSAIGEMLNHGLGFLIVTMAAFAAVFVIAERVGASRPGVTSDATYLVLLGVAALFMLDSTEYNLRTAARLVYYVIVICVGLRMFGRYQRRPT